MSSWSNRWKAFAHKMDIRMAWAFNPWFFVGVTAIFILGMSFGFLAGAKHSWSAFVAIIGAFTACCGIITIGRPMIRVGGYEEWARRIQIIDGGEATPTSAETEEREQQKKDAAAIQVIGPALAIVGTMINGVSGLFS